MVSLIRSRKEKSMPKLSSKQDQIAAALRDELESKTFDQITVTDICRKSKCSRQSFYYYFTSLSDCLVYYFLQERSLKGQFSSYRETALYFFEYVYRNRNFITNIFTADNQVMSIMNFFFKNIQTSMGRLMEMNNPDSKNLRPEDKEYIISYFASAWSFSFINWIHNGFQTTPEQEVERMFVIADGSLIEASNRFIRYRKESKI